jgi:hypothetical protein
LISPEKTKLTEQVANRWTVVVPVGTLPEDLDLRPDPFDLIAGLPLTKGDDIRAFTADERTIYDLIVVHCAGGRAWCRVTNVVKVPTFTEAAGGLGHVPEGFEITQSTRADAQDGWLIRRLADGVLLNGGQAPIYDHQEALRFLLNHPSVRGQKPMAPNKAVLT